MNANKLLWEKGDFTQLAATMRESGESLINSLVIEKELNVLDLGCGDGTTAIPAARLGAQVLGVDIASNLVKAGNIRAQAEGLNNCVFREGDACELVDLKVCTKTFRCCQRNGSCNPSGRQNSYGQLDTGRPDTGSTDTKNKFGIYTATTGRLC
jgi:SAM-dependent methyltransferase